MTADDRSVKKEKMAIFSTWFPVAGLAEWPDGRRLNANGRVLDRHDDDDDDGEGDSDALLWTAVAFVLCRPLSPMWRPTDGAAVAASAAVAAQGQTAGDDDDRARWTACHSAPSSKVGEVSRRHLCRHRCHRRHFLLLLSSVAL